MNKKSEKNKTRIRVVNHQIRQRENDESFVQRRFFRRLFTSSLRIFRKKIQN